MKKTLLTILTLFIFTASNAENNQITSSDKVLLEQVWLLSFGSGCGEGKEQKLLMKFTDTNGDALIDRFHTIKGSVAYDKFDNCKRAEAKRTKKKRFKVANIPVIVNKEQFIAALKGTPYLSKRSIIDIVEFSNKKMLFKYEDEKHSFKGSLVGLYWKDISESLDKKD